jgi:Ca2+-transporting ATPase
MLLLLIAVAFVSALLNLRSGQFPKDALAIAVVVVLNALLGYLQESKAEIALQALQDLAQPLVRARVAGEVLSLPAVELVPGDLVLMEAGDRVAADMRLLEAARLAVQEAALIGESLAVKKQAEQLLVAETRLQERINCVH